MVITRATKLYVKKSSGKFYAEIGDALWDVTQDVFELYIKGKRIAEQCTMRHGAVVSIAIAIQECKIKAVSLENIT